MTKIYTIIIIIIILIIIIIRAPKVSFYFHFLRAKCRILLLICVLVAAKYANFVCMFQIFNSKQDERLASRRQQQRLPSGRTSEPERLPSGRTSEPGATAERTNKRTERTGQKTRVMPPPFDDYSVRRRKRFCMNSDDFTIHFSMKWK